MADNTDLSSENPNMALAGDTLSGEIKDERVIAAHEWAIYEDARDRGHRDYIIEARKCQRFRWGGGRQWDENDRMELEAARRPVIEVNTIFPAINDVNGEQISTRMDISYRPKKSGASPETADALKKFALHVRDDNNYPYKESTVFEDGIVKRRGFFEIKMRFDENLFGEIDIRDKDPFDIIPDPDGQEYDPKSWRYVGETKWMSLDDIETEFGRDARLKVEGRIMDPGFGQDSVASSDGEGRDSFGKQSMAHRYYDATMVSEHGQKSVRVFSRQFYQLTSQWHYFNPTTGDIRPVEDNKTQDAARLFAQQNGWTLARIPRKRIRWRVSFRDGLLHDEWSPYSTYTIIPYFPYFDRGITVGLVDNAISPQELLNKSLSSTLHIVNSTANSGWLVPKDVLTNIATGDLTDVGMKTGLVIEYDPNKAGGAKPEKIKPNEVPQGTDRLIDRAQTYVDIVTGRASTERAMEAGDSSGTAIGKKMFQAKLQIAKPLDNLQLTRNLVARKFLELLQQYYTAERTIQITQPNDDGTMNHVPYTANQVTPEGRIVNDLTLGEYEIVTESVPTQATFDQNQFTQALEMKRLNVSIPDMYVLKYSTLADKNDIIKAISEQKPDPMIEAKIKEIVAKTLLLQSQAKESDSKGTVAAVQAQFSAVQSAQLIATMPQIANLADQLLLSAGFTDHDAAPIVPTPSGPVAVPAPVVARNNNPGYPPVPALADSGSMTGIEGGTA